MLEIKDLLKSVFQSKEDLATTIDDNSVVVERVLLEAPEMWVVKRIISFSPEYVNEVNDINVLPNVSETMQYDYLRFRMPKLKKAPYNPYIKPDKLTEDVKLVMEFYQYSESKARQALSILSPEQLQMIRDSYDEGGLVEKRKKKAE